MDGKISYIRQKDLFNPITQKFKIIVLGAGSLGSFITLNLAKLGFENITVYDYDKVTSYNVPNQLYRLKDVNQYKGDALKDIVKKFADVDININTKKVTKQTEFPIGLNNFYILTFDTLKERKMIFDKLKNLSGGHVCDCRMGGEEYNIQTINLFNEDEIASWKESFNITPADLPCGAKSIIYTNFSVAAEVCNIVKKVNNSENYPKRLIRHMKSYRIINNQNDK